MGSVRWRKIWRDLWENEMRTLMAVLAIAIGVFGVGSIMTTYAILTREINTNYMGTTPASAKLYVEGANRELATAVSHLPDIATAQVRRVIRARLQFGPDEWGPLKLFVIDDFNDLRVSTFTSESGNWPPNTGDILIERSSISVSRMQVGDQIVVQTPDGEARALSVSGIMHDPAQAPGWQDGIDYGYITADTLALLGEAATFNELHVLVAEDTMNVPHISDVAYRVRDFVQAQGYAVTAVTIPEPGKHPHTDQMDSLMFLLEAFGILALILSGILVANIIAALLAQQIRQIGAMKAIGGRTSQIAGLYFGTVLIFGLGALLIGIPLSVSAGRAYAGFTATLLNFNITSDAIPLWVFAVQIAIGLTVPLLAAAVPIFKGSRITVREAISDYGVGSAQFGSSVIDRLVTNVRGLSRPLALSLRNTFRRRTRLVLIVGILAVGGAAFMSTINVDRSWLNTIGVAFEARRFDVKVDFVTPYPVDQVEDAVTAIPGVTGVESWNQAVVVQEHADGSDGIRFNLTAVPADTELIAYPVIEGRWLQPGDSNALVINHEMLYDHDAGIRPGDTVTLRINGQPVEWQVVGVVREIGAPRRGLGIPASAYVPLDYFNQVTGSTGTTTTIRVQTAEHDTAAMQVMNQKLERQFDAAGLRRLDLQASTTRRRILEEHLVVILAFLMLMAVLVAAVGGLALASVVSINVMERSREIGIMRAIGASTGAILQVIMAEGLVIGLLSWVVAVAVARPLSVTVGNFAGWLFVRSDLAHVFSSGAMWGWLGLIVIISLAASFFPAWTAARLTVREVVAYE